MKTYIVLLTLTSLHTLSVTYEHRCLSSEPESVACNLCNFAIGFSNNGFGQCIRNCIPNCEFPSSNGTHCLQCRPGMLPKGSECIKFKDPLCLSLDPESSNCTLCKPGFFPLNNLCTATTTPIPNCLYYKSTSQCLYCYPGHYLFDNTCLLFDPNCLQPTPRSCLLCHSPLTSSSLSSPSIDNPLVTFLKLGLIPSPPSEACPPVPQSNCSKLNLKGDCLKCIPQFYLDSSDKLCKPADPLITNCLTYSEAGVCSECSPGKYISNNLCVDNPGTITTPSIPFCVSLDSSLNCLKCKSNYFLQSNECLEVTSPIPNCDTYSSNSLCQYCQPGFYILKNSCLPLLPSIDFCSSYSPSGCLICLSGYFLEDLSCKPVPTPIANCDLYSSASTCLSCLHGFALSNNLCEPLFANKIQNCLAYDSSSLCVYCSKSNILSADRLSCISLQSPLPRCAVHKSETECSLCDSDSVLYNGKCHLYPDPNCQSYSESAVCQYCITGHFFSSLTQDCSSVAEIPNCRHQSTDGSSCNICEEGFYWTSSSESCQSLEGVSVADCEIHLTPSECLYCKPNYYPSSDKTQCLTLPDPLPNCKLALDSLTCVVCNSDHFLSVGKCLPLPKIPNNCKAFNNMLECSLCESSFSFNSTTAQCEAVLSPVSNCFEYNANNCLSCTAPFVLNSNKCEHFFTTPIANCLIRSNESTCAQCDSGYFLSDNSCLLVTSPLAGCVYYSSDLVCKQCDSSHFIASDNKCYSLQVSNCKYFSSLFNCAVCLNSYSVTNVGTCSAVPTPIENCIEYDNNSLCKLCAPDTQLTNSGKCILPTPSPGTPIDHCAVYLNSTDCKHCEQDYYLNNNACVPVTVNINSCLFYKSDGICLKCFESAMLTSNGLCVENCEQLLDKKCTVCQPGFYLFNDVCLSAENSIVNCHYYLSKDKCKYCSSGYDLTSSSTCVPNSNSFAYCRYTAAAKCEICAKDFYPDSNGVCKPVAFDDGQKNCMFYEDGKRCRVCSINSYMNFVTRECEGLQPNTSCLMKDYTCMNVLEN